MEATTVERANIKVLQETWQALNGLKRPGDTFDAVIRRLLQQRESASAEKARSK